MKKRPREVVWVPKSSKYPLEKKKAPKKLMLYAKLSTWELNPRASNSNSMGYQSWQSRNLLAEQFLRLLPHTGIRPVLQLQKTG